MHDHVIRFLQPVDTVQVFKGNLQPLDHCLFSFAEPYTRVVFLLIGFVLTVGVSYLALEVVAVLCLVTAYAIPECPLGIGIDIHFHHTVSDSLAYLFLA